MMNGAKKIATSFNTISSLKRFFFSPTRLMQATKIFFAVHCLRNIFLIIYIWCLSTTGSLLSPCVTAQQTTNITQTTATLSEARAWLAASSASELVFFGGGYSGQVDICNVTSGSWSTATLSVPRGLLAATSSGNLVFFAGGQNGSPPTYYNQVDIYDLSYGKWTTATLSQARAALAATSVGNLVLFGGGATIYSGWLSVVDIYNVSSNTWTTAALSQSRYYLTATSVANRYALFLVVGLGRFHRVLLILLISMISIADCGAPPHLVKPEDFSHPHHSENWLSLEVVQLTVVKHPTLSIFSMLQPTHGTLQRLVKLVNGLLQQPSQISLHLEEVPAPRSYQLLICTI